MDEADRRALGDATRRAVLGGPHVDRANATTSPFNEDFQDLITRYAWGEIWTRPALPPETRRLLTIGMMIALNRSAELKLHVRAALQSGTAADLIKEVILHSAVYCGVPAANSAFHDAAEIFYELSQGQDSGEEL